MMSRIRVYGVTTLMQPPQRRITIVEKFSSFYQLIPSQRWVVNAYLRAIMTCLSEQQPFQSEGDWVIYFLNLNNIEKLIKLLGNRENLTEPLSDPQKLENIFPVLKKRTHWTSLDVLRHQFLFAYLEEAYYWGARQAYEAFTVVQLTYDEYWQTARKFPPIEILKSYNPEQNTLPSTYAQVKIRTKVIKEISVAVRVDNASDWGLLKQVSKKRLKEALTTQANLRESQLSRHLLAWFAFKSVYSCVKALHNRPLPAPNSKQLEAIVQYYCEVAPNQSPMDVVELETILKFCIQALRDNHQVKLLSTDINNPAISKHIAFESELKYQPLEDKKEEKTQQQGQILKNVFAKALRQLSRDDRKMLVLAFGFPGFPQKHIAEEFFGDPQNYRVVRRLSSIKEKLLEYWRSSILPHSELNLENSSQSEDTSDLEARLSDYLLSNILHNFLEKNLFYEPNLQQEVLFLSRVYSADLDDETFAAQKQEKAFFNQLEKSEKSKDQERLESIKRKLLEKLQQWMTIILECKPMTIEAAESSIEKLINNWLPQAPYAILLNKKGVQKQ